MEDAFIVNKSSAERGFAHATMYKSTRVDLKTDKKVDSTYTMAYCLFQYMSKAYVLGNDGARDSKFLDQDGLP